MSNTIVMATEANKDEILALYHTHLYGAARWNENYPSMETIEFDLSRDALFVMKNDADEIIATVSLDEDEEVDALPCWNKELLPAGELSRLCVREDMKNQGIAQQMMEYAFTVLKERGNKMVHILVCSEHVVALRSYAHLGYRQVGECDLFERHFVCLEREL